MNGICRIGAAVVLALAAAVPLPAQGAKLLPVDEAARDPSFARFRAQLLDAVRRKDAGFVHRILAPDITNSFGGDGGIAEFRESWKADRPRSRLWSTLEEVLARGGAFMGDSMFAAPYVYSNWPGRYDAFEYGAIAGSSVRVRSRPSPGAPVMATLSYDIVRMINEPGSDDFRAIRLPDGRTGYVAERYVRSPIGYRAIFIKRNGRWLLKALVIGD